MAILLCYVIFFAIWTTDDSSEWCPREDILGNDRLSSVLPDEFTVQNGTARDYEIVVADVRFNAIYIVSRMATSEADRAATLQAAARTYLNENKLHNVNAALHPYEFIGINPDKISFDRALAIASYTPDGCYRDNCDGSVWKISATGQQVTPLEGTIMREWMEHKNDKEFDNHFGRNVERLEMFISRHLNIPVDLVKRPCIFKRNITK